MTAPTPDTDVAFAAGAEAMREACAEFVRLHIMTDWYGLHTKQRRSEFETLATTIARLPLPPAPESTS